MARANNELSKEMRAARLKERIYLAFTILVVTLSLSNYDNIKARGAILTILLTAFGTLLAVFVADLIAHLAIHETPMSRDELRGLVSTTFSALGVVILPVAFLLAARWGWWEVSTALNASTIALVATLGIIGYTAIRRLKLNWLQRTVAIGAEILVALLVIVLKLITH